MERGDLIAGRYRLEGGTGEVWRAIEQGTETAVALKHIRLSQLPGDERQRTRERLRWETGVAALLDHPNIAKVHRMVEHEGDLWLVMEPVRAPSLVDLTIATPLSPRRAAGIGAQAAGALMYAHAATPSIVHGGVTTRNVLVGEGDHTKLADFGISADGAPGAGAYIAPEVANGMEPGPKSDVFSLAATLYAAVEGRSPWGEGDDEQIRAAAMKGIVEPPRSSGSLGPVLMRMLESRPRERPTAAEAAQMLGQVARSEKAGVRDVRGERTGGRRWVLAVVAAVAVVAVLAAVGLVVWPRTGQLAAEAPPPPGLGEPATADPCALLRPEPLDRFGDTTLETDDGNFDRCDVNIASADNRFGVRVQFGSSSSVLPAGVPEDRGNGLVIVRGDPVDNECMRTLRLPDGFDVRVSARLVRGVLPDPCGMADVATDFALGVLANGTVPRRAPFAPGSLAVVDACGLLDTPTVNTVPGLQNIPADPGFGGWACYWEVPPPPVAPGAPPPPAGPAVSVSYDRNKGISSEAGNRIKIAGRDAAARADADGFGCDVTVLHRSYIDPSGDPADELLLVKVDRVAGPRAKDPCTRSIAIATVAVNKLPPAP